MADAIDELFRRFGKAFNKADVEEIAACVTDDFEWRLNAGATGGASRPAGLAGGSGAAADGSAAAVRTAGVRYCGTTTPAPANIISAILPSFSS